MRKRFKAAMALKACFLLVSITISSIGITGEAQSTVTAPSTNFASVRDSITSGVLDFEPEELRILGSSEARGKLKDWSQGAIRGEVEFCRKGLKQLNATEALTASEKLDKKVLTAHLAYLEYYFGTYHGELGNLQISAYPYDLIQYELQRFSTSKGDAASALDHFSAVEKILSGLPGYLEQQESNLMAGLKLRKPDTQILQALIRRIGSQANQDSIRGGLKDISLKLEAIKVQQLLSASQRKVVHNLLESADAAYARHADFLTAKLVPQADDSWALGKDEYQRRFSLVYGNHVSLDELVKEAEAELQRVNAAMVSLAHELRPNLSLNETLDELRVEHLETEPALLQRYEQIQKKIDDKLTTRLGLPVGEARYLPAPVGVSVSPATNWPAPLLSPGPGIVLVDTSSAGLKDNALVDIPWVALHEGNPGHAAQSLLFQRAFNEGRAPLCRFLNVPDEVGYVRGNWFAMANIEGWAFYTERLLLSSGLLSREERLAALTGQALRTARVVVDVRMHTAGWSREDVTKYLVQNAGISNGAAKGQAYRYSRIPLQAVSYYLGARQFEKLYDKYNIRYGNRFYPELLSLGPVPPHLIGEYLESR